MDKLSGSGPARQAKPDKREKAKSHACDGYVFLALHISNLIRVLVPSAYSLSDRFVDLNLKNYVFYLQERQLLPKNP